MPRFLRVITGDAKAFANGPTQRQRLVELHRIRGPPADGQVPDLPPGQPGGPQLQVPELLGRQNIDSANHRAHVAFADETGNCGNGFKAIPQLPAHRL